MRIEYEQPSKSQASDNFLEEIAQVKNGNVLCAK